MVKDERDSWVSMAGSRTSGAASGATACRYCEHAGRVVAKTPKLESWIEECDKLGDRVSAFGRWWP